MSGIRMSYAAAIILSLASGRAWANDNNASSTNGVPLRLDLANTDTPAPTPSDSALLNDSGSGSGGDFFGDWFARVNEA
jgi:hypothetical protein